MTKLHGSRPDLIIMDDYFCEPTPVDAQLYARVKAYYDDCEAYDRTVCTGPIIHGSIMPANPRELGLINRYASQRLKQLKDETSGYPPEDIAHAKRSINR